MIESIKIRDILINNEEYYFNNTKISNSINAVSTGLIDLDDILRGGFQPSELIFIAGRPAMGKSAFALSISSNIVKNNLPVLFFSLEMSKEQIAERLLFQLAEVSKYSLNSSDKEYHFEKLSGAYNFLCKVPFYINESSELTLELIEEEIKNIILKNDKIGAVFIDYFQLMSIIGVENKAEEVSILTRGLKRIAKKFEVPIVVLSQVSVSTDKRVNKRPILSDLRYGFSIEEDADLIIFLYRDEYYNVNSDCKKTAELILAKHRNGPLGTIQLYFDQFLAKFSSLEKG